MSDDRNGYDLAPSWLNNHSSNSIQKKVKMCINSRNFYDGKILISRETIHESSGMISGYPTKNDFFWFPKSNFFW